MQLHALGNWFEINSMKSENVLYGGLVNCFSLAELLVLVKFSFCFENIFV